MKKSLLPVAALAAAASAGSAFAADLPSRRAPQPAYVAPVRTVPAWTGFYVGVNAGAAIRNRSHNGNGVPMFALLGGAPPLWLPNRGGNGNVGFTGGGQVGFNWQTGPLVLGIESDANYRSGNRGNFIGTTRARAGYAFDRALIYATGGLAYGTASNRNFLFDNGNSMRVGYAVGAGLEYALTPNWSIKGEYLYTDLGHGSANFLGFQGPREQTHLVRLGVNYKFDFGAPVIARY